MFVVYVGLNVVYFTQVRLVQSGSGKKKYEPPDKITNLEEYQMGFIPGEQGLHQVCFLDGVINFVVLLFPAEVFVG